MNAGGDSYRLSGWFNAVCETGTPRSSRGHLARLLAFAVHTLFALFIKAHLADDRERILTQARERHAKPLVAQSIRLPTPAPEPVLKTRGTRLKSLSCSPW